MTPRRALAAAGGLLAALLLVELGLRLAGLPARPPTGDVADEGYGIYRPHPYLPYVLREGASSPPGFVTQYRVDAQGFRGAPLADTVRDDVLRIACLGGSTTWGDGATGDEATWPARLDALLTRQLAHGDGPWRDAEVLNAGVSGYTLLDSLLNLELRVLPLRPDVVVVYHGINDAFVIGRGHWRPDQTHARRPWRWRREPDGPLAPSRLWQLLSPGDPPRRNLDDLVTVDGFREQPVDADPAPGLARFERTLAEFVAVARTSGCEVVLCTFATRDVPGNATERAEALAIVARLDAAITAAAARHGAPLVDVSGALTGRRELFLDSVHMNDRGYRLLAGELARGLEAAGLLTAPRRPGVVVPPLR